MHILEEEFHCSSICPNSCFKGGH